MPTAALTKGQAAASAAEQTPTLSPAPTQTRLPTSPTLIPTPTPLLYIVAKDDTLLGIALEFDISVEALLAVNGIAEDDFLQIGQELIIPTSAETTATAGNTPAASGQTEISIATATPPTNAVTEAIAPGKANTAFEAIEEGEAITDAAASKAVAGSGAEPAAPAAPQVAASDSSAAVTGPPPPAISRPANINPLTGLAVDDPARLQRRPLLVRVGNDTGARQSQAGLNSADIVYEEITEWWVTRFTAIYLSETPKTVRG